MTATDPEACEAMRAQIVETLGEHADPIPHSESGPNKPFRFWVRCQFADQGCDWESSHVSDREDAFLEHRAHLADVLLGLWDGDES